MIRKVVRIEKKGIHESDNNQTIASNSTQFNSPLRIRCVELNSKPNAVNVYSYKLNNKRLVTYYLTKEGYDMNGIHWRETIVSSYIAHIYVHTMALRLHPCQDH